MRKKFSFIALSLLGLALTACGGSDTVGLHVDEAKNELVKYIDNCRLKHFSQVRIIHGFGSGALRKMVREYLDTQKDIKYRPGDGSEGGGGATVVIFK